MKKIIFFITISIMIFSFETISAQNNNEKVNEISINTDNSDQNKASVGILVTKKIKKDKVKTENGSAIVSKDVVIDGNIVIAAGTPVILDIEKSNHKGLGQPGTIAVRPVSTTDVNGNVISLLGDEKRDTGKNRRTAALGCGITFGIVLTPVGLLFLCIKGGKAVIPAGTIMVAQAILP